MKGIKMKTTNIKRFFTALIFSIILCFSSINLSYADESRANLDEQSWSGGSVNEGKCRGEFKNRVGYGLDEKKCFNATIGPDIESYFCKIEDRDDCWYVNTSDRLHTKQYIDGFEFNVCGYIGDERAVYSRQASVIFFYNRAHKELRLYSFGDTLHWTYWYPTGSTSILDDEMVNPCNKNDKFTIAREVETICFDQKIDRIRKGTFKDCVKLNKIFLLDEPGCKDRIAKYENARLREIDDDAFKRAGNQNTLRNHRLFQDRHCIQNNLINISRFRKGSPLYTGDYLDFSTVSVYYLYPTHR